MSDKLIKEIIADAEFTKRVIFKRMPQKSVKGYNIYAQYADDTQVIGYRNELLGYLENKVNPRPPKTRILLEPDINAAWLLPEDALIDRDHKFYLYINNAILSSMKFNYNRITRIISIDQVIREYRLSDTVELEYYRDVIDTSYIVHGDCRIIIEPVFYNTHTLGKHNIIL